MKRWKPILVITLVFLAGTIFGVVATRVVTRAVLQRMLTHPDLVRTRIERELGRRLRLDAHQREQAHETLVEAQTQLHALRTETQPRFRQIISNAESKINVTLTPEQQQKFEQMRAKNRLLLAPWAGTDR